MGSECTASGTLGDHSGMLHNAARFTPKAAKKSSMTTFTDEGVFPWNCHRAILFTAGPAFSLVGEPIELSKYQR
jgi:hypothetical protein